MSAQPPPRSIHIDRTADTASGGSPVAHHVEDPIDFDISNPPEVHQYLMSKEHLHYPRDVLHSSEENMHIYERKHLLDRRDARLMQPSPTLQEAMLLAHQMALRDRAAAAAAGASGVAAPVDDEEEDDEDEAEEDDNE